MSEDVRNDWLGDDPFVPDGELKAAWARHDAELRGMGIDPRTTWSGKLQGRALNNILGQRLTDRKIAQYEKQGFYSPEYRAARKANAEKKFAKKLKRVGNFDVGEGGRMIYRPL